MVSKMHIFTIQSDTISYNANILIFDRNTFLPLKRIPIYSDEISSVFSLENEQRYLVIDRHFSNSLRYMHISIDLQVTSQAKWFQFNGNMNQIATFGAKLFNNSFHIFQSDSNFNYFGKSNYQMMFHLLDLNLVSLTCETINDYQGEETISDESIDISSNYLNFIDPNITSLLLTNTTYNLKDSKYDLSNYKVYNFDD